MLVAEIDLVQLIRARVEQCCPVQTPPGNPD